MPRSRIRTSVRREAAQRAKYLCEYCGSQDSFASQPFSVDHIIPASEGGSDGLDNLAYSCYGCNGHKYNKTQAIDPATKETVALFHPRNQIWVDHFAWNEDCTLIKGLTSIGRATVEALRLNRASVVNLRRVLFALGLHPPIEE